MRFDLMHPADQLVMMMRRIYACGMTTTSGGNLSIRDQGGDIWITPSGVDKGALGREDIMRVTPDGQVHGRHTPSVELPFHARVYALRPDLHAIVHAHPPTLVAFSLARTLPCDRLVPQVPRLCARMAMAGYDVPGSERLTEYVSARFAQGCDTVMMENHGCVCGGRDILTAFAAFETIDFSARMEVLARRLGTPRRLTDDQLAMADACAAAMDTFPAEAAGSEERAARRDLCALLHRACDQRLQGGTQGTFSQRLADGSFLITPHGMDRSHVQIEDLVRVRGGRCEAGKVPSRWARLHQAIYDAHADIGAVIIAQPAAIMAFAITGAPFDTRTVPESYVMLRDVLRLPFGAAWQDAPGVAQSLGARTPVALVDNECAIITGDTLLRAFDRMEVLDYSARTFIEVGDIGEPVMITDEEVRTLQAVYGLEG